MIHKETIVTKKNLEPAAACSPRQWSVPDVGEGTAVNELTSSVATATAGAMRSARGVKVADEAVPGAAVPSAKLTSVAGEAVQSLDSLALEIRGLLGSLRALASLSADATVSADERSVIQDEFSMIQARHAFITRPHTGSVLECDDGLGQADGMTRLTPQALGVSDSVASVVTAEDAEWALVRIDAAEQSVQVFRDECGTVEERVDAALARLAEFVAASSPVSVRQGRATDIFAAAERIRLQIMQEAGVTIVGQSSHLPKGVSPLLQ